MTSSCSPTSSSGLVLEPLGEALVELRARFLQQSPVRGVADQDVVEPEDRLVDPVRPVRLDELLAPERLEVAVEIRSRPTSVRATTTAPR